MAELDIMHRVMLAVGRLPGIRVFRNNVAQGWVGSVVKRTSSTITLSNYRPIHAGLCNGSSDLIGWRTVTITPDMVGKQVAIFTAIEVKTEKGRPSADQLNFLRVVKDAGGIGEITRSPEEAARIFE